MKKLFVSLFALAALANAAFGWDVPADKGGCWVENPDSTDIRHNERGESIGWHKEHISGCSIDKFVRMGATVHRAWDHAGKWGDIYYLNNTICWLNILAEDWAGGRAHFHFSENDGYKCPKTNAIGFRGARIFASPDHTDNHLWCDEEVKRQKDWNWMLWPQRCQRTNMAQKPFVPFGSYLSDPSAVDAEKFSLADGTKFLLADAWTTAEWHSGAKKVVDMIRIPYENTADHRPRDAAFSKGIYKDKPLYPVNIDLLPCSVFSRPGQCAAPISPHYDNENFLGESYGFSGKTALDVSKLTTEDKSQDDFRVYKLEGKNRPPFEIIGAWVKKPGETSDEKTWAVLEGSNAAIDQNAALYPSSSGKIKDVNAAPDKENDFYVIMANSNNDNGWNDFAKRFEARVPIGFVKDRCGNEIIYKIRANPMSLRGKNRDNRYATANFGLLRVLFWSDSHWFKRTRPNGDYFYVPVEADYWVDNFLEHEQVFYLHFEPDKKSSSGVKDCFPKEPAKVNMVTYYDPNSKDVNVPEADFTQLNAKYQAANGALTRITGKNAAYGFDVAKKDLAIANPRFIAVSSEVDVMLGDGQNAARQLHGEERNNLAMALAVDQSINEGRLKIFDISSTELFKGAKTSHRIAVLLKNLYLGKGDLPEYLDLPIYILDASPAGKSYSLNAAQKINHERLSVRTQWLRPSTYDGSGLSFPGGLANERSMASDAVYTFSASVWEFDAGGSTFTILDRLNGAPHRYIIADQWLNAPIRGEFLRPLNLRYGLKDVTVSNILKDSGIKPQHRCRISHQLDKRANEQGADGRINCSVPGFANVPNARDPKSLISTRAALDSRARTNALFANNPHFALNIEYSLGAVPTQLAGDIRIDMSDKISYAHPEDLKEFTCAGLRCSCLDEPAGCGFKDFSEPVFKADKINEEFARVARHICEETKCSQPGTGPNDDKKYLSDLAYEQVSMNSPIEFGASLLEAPRYDTTVRRAGTSWDPSVARVIKRINIMKSLRQSELELNGSKIPVVEPRLQFSDLYAKKGAQVLRPKLDFSDTAHDGSKVNISRSSEQLYFLLHPANAKLRYLGAGNGLDMKDISLEAGCALDAGKICYDPAADGHPGFETAPGLKLQLRSDMGVRTYTGDVHELFKAHEMSFHGGSATAGKGPGALGGVSQADAIASAAGSGGVDFAFTLAAGDALLNACGVAGPAIMLPAHRYLSASKARDVVRCSGLFSCEDFVVEVDLPSTYATSKPSRALGECLQNLR